MSAYQNDPKVNFVYSHTSGHATVKNLQEFAKAICPKVLIPIHTEHGGKFQEFFDNVRIVRDNEPFSI